jgi:hypothetical protein
MIMQVARRTGIMLLVLMMAMVLMACPKNGTTTQPLTAKQQATIWMDVYNATYDDTMAVMKNPASTPAQKDMAQKKKAILTQVWPLLKVYISVVDNGGTPSVESVAAITGYMNQLTALATGGK